MGPFTVNGSELWYWKLKEGLRYVHYKVTCTFVCFLLKRARKRNLRKSLTWRTYGVWRVMQKTGSRLQMWTVRNIREQIRFIELFNRWYIQLPRYFERLVTLSLFLCAQLVFFTLFVVCPVLEPQTKLQKAAVVKTFIYSFSYYIGRVFWKFGNQLGRIVEDEAVRHVFSVYLSTCYFPL
jgi:hypothetical protein